MQWPWEVLLVYFWTLEWPKLQHGSSVQEGPGFDSCPVPFVSVSSQFSTTYSNSPITVLQQGTGNVWQITVMYNHVILTQGLHKCSHLKIPKVTALLLWFSEFSKSVSLCRASCPSVLVIQQIALFKGLYDRNSALYHGSRLQEPNISRISERSNKLLVSEMYLLQGALLMYALMHMSEKDQFIVFNICFNYQQYSVTFSYIPVCNRASW